MGLFRLIALLAIIWLVLGLVRRLRSGPAQPPPAGRVASTHMVRCDRCGVYVPEGEAVHAGERVYCSSAHRDEDGQG